MTEILYVPDAIADSVEKWVTSTKIPWFYFGGTLGHNDKGRYPVEQDKYLIKDQPRFTHYFYPNSKTADLDRKHIIPLTEWIKKEVLPGYEVQRVMGNMTTQTYGADKLINIPHVDSDLPNMFTFLYYVNSSDGKTVFFKDRQIELEAEPLKGTGALFSSNTVHAGQVPTINKNRYVINILLAKRD